MTANEINQTMEALSDQLNLLGPSADTAKVAQLSKAVADWQDFYWSNLDQWPVNELAVWEQNLDNFATLLAQLQAAAGVLDTAPHTAPGTVTQLPGSGVTGTWPMWMKIGSIAVLGFGLYKVARRFHVLE